MDVEVNGKDMALDISLTAVSGDNVEETRDSLLPFTTISIIVVGVILFVIFLLVLILKRRSR